MTVTTPTHVDSSIPELWAKLTLADSLRPGFWAKFRGPEGSRSPVIYRSDTLSQPGDTIHVQVTSPLSGSGVAGDTTALEGSEENLTTSSIKVVPLFYRHAVKWYRRANKKSMLELRQEAQKRLAEWGGEKMDDLRFTNFLYSGTFNGEAYTPYGLAVGGGTAASDIGSTDTLDVESIQKLKVKLYDNKAIPLVTADGEEYFALVAHQYALYDLKRSDEYRDWVREAEVRGKDNPFFRGALCMVDGVLIYQHSNVPVATNVASNLAFGAEAFIEGVDESPSWVERDHFDYGNEIGIAYQFGFQPRRALEKNSCVLFSYATNPAT